MNISKQEAQESLNEIRSVIEQTRRCIGNSASSSILIVWGMIWVVGYSCTQFFPDKANHVWPPLVAFGAISSWYLGSRRRLEMHNPNGGRIGAFWLILFGYAALWLFILHPAKLPSGAEWAHYQPMNDRQISAFIATIPMFAYVVGGLWFGRFFVFLGALITLTTVLGYVYLPGWFYLWMAITGGGSLITAGLYIRNNWK